MTQAQQQVMDPFEQGQGVPAISFKDAPIPSLITISVDDDAKWLQSRDYETGELDYWDARPGETPNPKMAAVVTGVVQDTPWARQLGIVGERRSVWAGKPSNMFTAIQNAKRAVGPGTQITPGGTLDIAFTGEEPNAKNPRLNNIKLYQARYTPAPAGYGVVDAFEQAGQQQQGAVSQPFGQPQGQPSAFVQQAAPVAAQVGTFAGQQAPAQQFQPQQPQGQPFGQAPVQPQQQFAQAPAQQFQPQQPQGQPFGQAPVQPQQQASAQQFQPQQPQGQPFGQAPVQPQQPAMAGAPAGDPWSNAPTAQPSGDIPPF